MRAPYYTSENLEAGKSVGFLVKHSGVLMTQVAAHRFESLPISFTQWLVLMHVDRQERMSATQLSLHLGYDMGALTRVVDGLVRRRLVRRDRSRSDRRAVEITITAAGRRQAQLGKGAVTELLNRLLEPFTNQEVDTLIALLQRLMGNLQSTADQVAATPGGARRAPRKSSSGGKA
jgi:MarR family transcriptional regulator for hemolysin